MKSNELEQILSNVRKSLLDFAGEDPDKLFYARRFIFARLQLGERKTKTKIKKELFQENPFCDYEKCDSKRLESLTNPYKT